jgi:hypothetical protein
MVTCLSKTYFFPTKIEILFNFFCVSYITQTPFLTLIYFRNGNTDNESYGFLSKLLGFGCECFGYNIRIVGHSLGGAIAALLGLQVWHF